MPTRPAPTFVATHTPGATPPIKGAPVLPSPLVLSGWPPQDKIPDTNSDEVKAWMKELEGFDIPAFLRLRIPPVLETLLQHQRLRNVGGGHVVDILEALILWLVRQARLGPQL
ncbi:hypothetical protein BDZ97DRAFT_502769 [Flammula alnicola]|nr:hypothetical protein BDZ97DRAFT_502769 [Flammula alnicola]